MKQTTFFAGLIAATILAVAACGDSDDPQVFEQEAAAAAAEHSVDPASLPDDFPQELIPPTYDKADYVDLQAINGTRAITFESAEHVQRSIDYYIDVLGEPTINVDSGDGDRLAQWHKSPFPPWMVGVMGNDGETIVTVNTAPEQ